MPSFHRCLARLLYGMAYRLRRVQIARESRQIFRGRHRWIDAAWPLCDPPNRRYFAVFQINYKQWMAAFLLEFSSFGRVFGQRPLSLTAVASHQAGKIVLFGQRSATVARSCFVHEMLTLLLESINFTARANPVSNCRWPEIWRAVVQYVRYFWSESGLADFDDSKNKQPDLRLVAFPARACNQALCSNFLTVSVFFPKRLFSPPSY